MTARPSLPNGLGFAAHKTIKASVVAPQEILFMPTISVSRRLLTVLGTATILAGMPGVAAAQETPSDVFAINLVRGMVEQGVLTQAQAEAIIAKAEADTAAARASQAAAVTQAPASSVSAASGGTRIRYVPQAVRDQIKAEVKQEVLAEARTGGLVAPDAVPEWTKAVRISGDLRLRSDSIFLDRSNNPQFVDGAAVNAGPPYNGVDNPYLPPILNTTADRQFFRVRARIGIDARVDEDLGIGLRIATGDNDGPVSTNQALGGYMAKKDLWLDRAYMDFTPLAGGKLTLGRMPNPFRQPELVWDEDVNLDGAVVSYERPVFDEVKLFGLAGAFPLDFIGQDAPSTALGDDKSSSKQNKWLFAGQIGARWEAADRFLLESNAAYYHYMGVEGVISPSCLNIADYCRLDFKRPGFMQRGNTLFALRDTVTNDPSNQDSPQYYGLASQFHILALAASADWQVDEALHIRLGGQFARNIGFDYTDMRRRAANPQTGVSQLVNNLEPCRVALVGGICPPGAVAALSGNDAWLVRATIGTLDLGSRGDWSVSPIPIAAGAWSISASYRRIAPDALLDAFVDSDFHLGGTNARGYTLSGSYAIRRNTLLTLRWLSADEVVGPQLRADVLHADVAVKF